MNRRHYLLTAALSLAVVLTGHVLYGALAAPPAARAAAEPRRDAQWEYCAVAKPQGIATPRLFMTIYYFKGDGMTTESVEAGLQGNSYGKAIAKLGADGWEMVGEGPLNILPDPRPTAPSTIALFFKRRKD